MKNILEKLFVYLKMKEWHTIVKNANMKEWHTIVKNANMITLAKYCDFLLPANNLIDVIESTYKTKKLFSQCMLLKVKIKCVWRTQTIKDTLSPKVLRHGLNIFIH
jgi:hypothetical protein